MNETAKRLLRRIQSIDSAATDNRRQAETDQHGRAAARDARRRDLPGRQYKGFWQLGDQLDVLDPVSDHREPAELILALDVRCDILDLIRQRVWA